MTIEEMQMKNFLQQLYQISGGDISAEASMYDIGAALGLDKMEAGAVAEDLIIDGFAELKNLAGGISITTEGLKALDIVVPDSGDDQPPKGVVLGENEVLDPEVREAVEQLLGEIKSAASGSENGYETMEEIVIDIKTLEIQFLSNRPKTAITREILSSLAKLLAKQENTASVVGKIRRMIGDV